MSRSYKKQPFQSICGANSAKKDKQLAARGVRRTNRYLLRAALDLEEYLPPHRYECSHNEVYSWNRDGNQMYRPLRSKDWHDHLKALNDIAQGINSWEARYDAEWPPDWYTQMMRK